MMTLHDNLIRGPD